MEVKTVYCFVSLILLGLILLLWMFFLFFVFTNLSFPFQNWFFFSLSAFILNAFWEKDGYKRKVKLITILHHYIWHVKLRRKILDFRERSCCQTSTALSGRCSLLNNFGRVMKDKTFHMDKHAIFPVFLTIGICGVFFSIDRLNPTK